MSATLSLVLDLVLVGLLATTIAYAIILNREIIKLRESRGEMADLIKGLNEAMARAETGVRSLKKTANDTGEDLQRTVNKAQTLRDELEFMIEAADAMANRLGTVGGDRPKPAAPPPRPAARSGLGARPPVASRPLIEDEDDAPPLLRADALRADALRADPLRADSLRSAEPPARRTAASSDARDSILREGESLSRAERELLQAIENAGKGVG
ncbi:DUF6468 domain-containing protein [Azospirillum sp. sgz302134]